MLGSVDFSALAGFAPAAAPTLPARPSPETQSQNAGAAGPRDTVGVSPEALERLAADAGGAEAEAGEADGPGGDLTEEEQQIVTELRARDREVRAHEQAHARVGGQYAGAPTYDYQTGPDGQRYAVGGEVSIDVSPIDGDPEATIDKLEQVRAAALAPAEPSAQDRRVAAQAQAGIANARGELAAQRREERLGGGGAAPPTGAGVGEGPSLVGQDPAARQAVEAYARAAGLR